MAIDLRRNLLGGSVPVGSAVLFDNRENLIVQGVSTYLKTGIVETDYASYPDFPVKFYYTGVTSVVDPVAQIQAMCSGGGFIWVVVAGNILYKLNEDGSLTGVSYTLAGGGAVLEITFADNHLWVLHSTATKPRPIIKYGLTSGTIVSQFGTNETTIDVVTLGSDGTKLYTINTSDQLKRYDLTGTLESTIQMGKTYRHLKWDGEYFLTTIPQSYVYLDINGVEQFKQGYATWNTSPQPSDFTLSADGNTLIGGVVNSVGFWGKGIFGGLSPTENSPTYATVYWRIK